MGKAEILSHIADGQYTAKILYDETQLQAQIDAVVQALTDIASQITEAAARIVTLESELAQQKEALRLKVLEFRTLIEEQPALEDAVEARAAELEELEEELQSLKDAGAEQFYIDSKQAEVDAKELELQQAQSDLSVNKSNISAAQTEIDTLYDTAAKTKAQLTLANGKHGNLILRQATLDARLLELDANNPPEDIRDVWCADLTEDLTGEWPTLDIPGESELILLAPEEYVDEHNLHATPGQLAPVVAMSPAQAAFNYAIHPGWQRHKPTYRVGVITAIDTTEDTADVTLDAATSRYQNLNVNENTTLAGIDVVYMSCNAAAFEVDDRVVVEFPYQIPSEQHLQQTISNLADAHAQALAFKTDLETRLAEIEADKTAAEAERDSLAAQLAAQMSADPVDMTAIEITLAQQVVNGAELSRLIQKQLSTNLSISATSNRIQRIQAAFDDATALAAVYPGPRVIGFETEPQACAWKISVRVTQDYFGVKGFPGGDDFLIINIANFGSLSAAGGTFELWEDLKDKDNNIIGKAVYEEIEDGRRIINSFITATNVWTIYTYEKPEDEEFFLSGNVGPWGVNTQYPFRWSHSDKGNPADRISIPEDPDEVYELLIATWRVENLNPITISYDETNTLVTGRANWPYPSNSWSYTNDDESKCDDHNAFYPVAFGYMFMEDSRLTFDGPTHHLLTTRAGYERKIRITSSMPYRITETVAGKGSHFYDGLHAFFQQDGYEYFPRDAGGECYDIPPNYKTSCTAVTGGSVGGSFGAYYKVQISVIGDLVNYQGDDNTTLISEISGWLGPTGGRQHQMTISWSASGGSHTDDFFCRESRPWPEPAIEHWWSADFDITPLGVFEFKFNGTSRSVLAKTGLSASRQM